MSAENTATAPAPVASTEASKTVESTTQTTTAPPTEEKEEGTGKKEVETGEKRKADEAPTEGEGEGDKK
jgi:hypothetical protein